MSKSCEKPLDQLVHTSRTAVRPGRRNTDLPIMTKGVSGLLAGSNERQVRETAVAERRIEITPVSGPAGVTTDAASILLERPGIDLAMLPKTVLSTFGGSPRAQLKSQTVRLKTRSNLFA